MFQKNKIIINKKMFEIFVKHAIHSFFINIINFIPKIWKSKITSIYFIFIIWLQNEDKFILQFCHFLK